MRARKRKSPPRTRRNLSPLRRQLGAAACVLLASGIPAGARAADPKWQFDGSVLLYGEQGRTKVFEPMAQITRLYASGQTLSARLGIDAITGATPSGALPSGQVQTTTSASGTVHTTSPDQIPLTRFRDTRAALDLSWQRPLGLLTSETGLHLSKERDYTSLGANAKLSLALMDKLTTVTIGASGNRDDVEPIGGMRNGLVDVPAVTPANPGGEGDEKAPGIAATDAYIIPGVRSSLKRVGGVLAGISRIVTRRWMVGLDGAHSTERGYLTEPYKVLSVLNPITGVPVASMTEKRPATRTRSDVLASSVYHLNRDVLYASYRYYWDDWSVRSHTFDLKYRHELENQAYVQPHIRFYTQTPAAFYTSNLFDGAPLPAFASSDYRLGPLDTLTLGATYGFHATGYPGQFTIRAEYMVQWGQNHPPGAVGLERSFDLFPPLQIGELTATYSVQF